MRATVYSFSGRLTEAAADYVRALEIAEHPLTLRCLVRCRVDLGEDTKVLALESQIRKHANGRHGVRLLNNLAVAAYRSGDRKRAAKVMKEATALAVRWE